MIAELASAPSGMKFGQLPRGDAKAFGRESSMMGEAKDYAFVQAKLFGEL